MTTIALLAGPQPGRWRLPVAPVLAAALLVMVVVALLPVLRTSSVVPHTTAGQQVAVATIEARLRADMASRTGLDITAQCDAGAAVVATVPGTAVPCTVANAQDPGDALDVTATITDTAGSVTFAAGG